MLTTKPEATVAESTETKELMSQLPFAILDEELSALRRFHETAGDEGTYDVPKAMMRRLAEIGLLHHISAGIYEETTFGMSVLNGDFATPQSPGGAVTVPREPSNAVVYIKTNHYRGTSVNVANVFSDEKSAIEQVEKWHGGNQHYHDAGRPELCDWCKSMWRRAGNSLIRTVNHDGAVIDYELRTMPMLDAALNGGKGAAHD